MTDRKSKIIQTTVRLPEKIWLQLRRLEEQGKIKSIHAAILKGLELIIKEFKGNDKNNLS